MFFEKFGATVRNDAAIVQAVEAGHWERAVDYVQREVFNRPEEYFNLEKLRRAAGVDRRVSLREILEKIFGLIPAFKSRDELMEEEFAKFVADHTPDEPAAIPAIKHFFKAYLGDEVVRQAIDSRNFNALATHAAFSLGDLRAVPDQYRRLAPEYIKDYVALNQFAG
jgi:type I restriction enzyme R subunit